jgi:hypothetical protein
MEMTPKIDQFYNDSVFGIIKFIGYKGGNLIFDKYEKSFVERGAFSGWLPAGQRVNLEPEFQRRRFRAGNTKPIPPPQ